MSLYTSVHDLSFDASSGVVAALLIEQQGFYSLAVQSFSRRIIIAAQCCLVWSSLNYRHPSLPHWYRYFHYCYYSHRHSHHRRHRNCPTPILSFAMSVLLELGETGDIVIDLLVDYAPKACENFLKLYVTARNPPNPSLAPCCSSQTPVPDG